MAFLPPLDFFIVNVALPSIQGDLGTSSSAEQMVISAYVALYAVTLITGGRLLRHQASYPARRLA